MQVEAKEATATALQAQLAQQMADAAIKKVSMQSQLDSTRKDLEETQVFKCTTYTV